MKHFVGLDVSLDLTSVCVLDEEGAVVWRGKVASTPEALTEGIRKHAPSVVKIGLETGPLCTWHWHAFLSSALMPGMLGRRCRFSCTRLMTMMPTA